MRIEAGLLAAAAVIAGLGLLASSGPPRMVQGGVVLNKAPPPSPGSKLAWSDWPPLMTAASPAERPLPAEAAAPPTDAGPPRVADAAGIWATPAEFAPSD